MLNTKMAWAEVGDHLSALALKLKLHAEEEFSEEDDDVTSALGKLTDAAKETFETIERSVRDDGVRDDVRAAAEALGNALRATMQELRAAVPDRK